LDWAKTVTAQEYTGLAQAEQRILDAGVPGASEPRRQQRPRSRWRGWAGFLLAVVLIAAPIGGMVAFFERSILFTNGYIRFFDLQLSPNTRLWMSAACFSIALLEPLVILWAWFKTGRERDLVLAGICLGIAIFAVLALCRSTLVPDVTPHGEFDARLVPAVVSIITGAISGCIIFVGSKRPGSIPQVAQPSWVPVKSSELRSLSIHDMNALMEERRAVLLVLSERGLITQNVNELDRKPLGSLD
jgi:hypothetical protein